MFKNTIRYIYFPSLAIIIMWLSKLSEFVLHADYRNFGLFPRTFEGIRGIITSPFIHNDFDHLISNTVPFFVLSTSIFYFYRKHALIIIFYSWLLTEALVWIGARSAMHIGSSGLVYAFASFLFFSGILSKERRLVAISLLVIFLYGGMIWGIFPGEYGISWESHLFGFITGFAIAFYIGKTETETPKEKDQETDFSVKNYTHENEYDIHYHFEDEDSEDSNS